MYVGAKAYSLLLPRLSVGFFLLRGRHLTRMETNLPRFSPLVSVGQGDTGRNHLVFYCKLIPLSPCYLIFFTPGRLQDLHSILFSSAATRLWLCNQYSAFNFLLSVNYLSGTTAWQTNWVTICLSIKPTAHHILHAMLHRSAASEPQHYHVTVVLIS